jgi:competence protein ComEA
VDPVVPPGIDPAAADASLPGDSGAADHATGPAVPAVKHSVPAAVVVAVGGKVRKPGLVELAPGARVADALKAAGGAAPGVDVAPLNLARKVTDGELIMVGVTPPPGAAPPAPPGPAVPGQPGAGPINLNTATLADLDTLPGVGPVLAQRILAAREAQGGFKAVSDLRNVQGIGSSRYEQLKDLVTV